VAQERFLSPRVIHFAKGMVYWVCDDLISNEVYPRALPKPMNPYVELETDLGRLRNIISIGDRLLHEPLKSGTPENLYKAYHLWARVRGEYSSMGMTVKSDRLTALQGIAQRFTEALKDKFVYGHSKRFLLHELAWRVHKTVHDCYRPSRQSSWRAPSWSWGCLNTGISIFREMNRNRKALSSIVRYPSEGGTLTDELSSSSILVQCRPMNATKGLHEGLQKGLQEEWKFGGRSIEYYDLEDPTGQMFAELIFRGLECISIIRMRREPRALSTR
jgi:hypothetical protein